MEHSPIVSEKVVVVAALVRIRAEWEQAAQGISLIDVHGSVGLMLADFTEAIGLTGEERTQVLGDGLSHELHELIYQ